MLLLSVSIAIGYDSFLEINQISQMEIKLLKLTECISRIYCKFSNEVHFYMEHWQPAGDFGQLLLQERFKPGSKKIIK